ncbi:hypothetical protein GOBAR_DD13523 [Gossypium barbadense]|nr:hypothetical protein GOBAR_DD13523 [Gossypium barbadense]
MLDREASLRQARAEASLSDGISWVSFDQKKAKPIRDFRKVALHKHEAGFAVEWSIDEQYILEDSLEKYKDEPSIMKYIKFAATLPDKTVRDVALRCWWMQVSSLLL